MYRGVESLCGLSNAKKVPIDLPTNECESNSTTFFLAIQNNNIIASRIAYFKFHGRCDRFLEQDTVQSVLDFRMYV